MKIRIRGYITHKEAEKYSDCADRYAVNIENNRFAIADGVSKSFFPNYWADILVNSFVELEKSTELSIEKCQAEWFEKVKERVSVPDAKWYTRNAFVKQEAGLATFVGLRFENNKWIAEAIGDSFLFFVPNNEKGFDDWIKLSSKPLPVIFDSYPDYYSSRSKQHGDSVRLENILTEGTFYLMTDALSEWVYNQKEQAIEIINTKWKNQDEFENGINDLRLHNILNNDDSAILIIEIENDGENEFNYEKLEIQSLSELISKEVSEDVKLAEEREESFIKEAKSEIENKGLLHDENSEGKNKEETNSSNEKVNVINSIEEESQSSNQSFSTEFNTHKKSIITNCKDKNEAVNNASKNSKFNKAKRHFIIELNKLKIDEQKEILINLCKDYDIPFKN